MKTIVCFGDSNTWGYSPSGLGRYPFEKRWTSILQKELGADYFVIPEGLNGRTTAFEDRIEKDKNGEFIPLCTKNVFLKYYSDDVQDLFFWNSNDREDYINEIESVINNF